MTVTIHPRTSNLTAEEIEAWREIPSSVVVDLEPDGQIDPDISRLTTSPASQLLGPALTIEVTPPDFGAAVLALDHAQAGDVVVVAGGGQIQTALIGEILGGHLKEIGCAGVIVDSPVRDIETLGSWQDFPVYARCVNPRGPTSATGGTLNGSVTFGNCQINQGDLIIGDKDGLVVLNPDQARNRIADAQARLALEDQWIEGLKAGKSAKEIFGL